MLRVFFSRVDALVKEALAIVGIGVARLPDCNVGAFLNSSLSEGRPGDEDIENIESVWFRMGEEERGMTWAEAMVVERGISMRLPRWKNGSFDAGYNLELIQCVFPSRPNISIASDKI